MFPASPFRLPTKRLFAVAVCLALLAATLVFTPIPARAAVTDVFVANATCVSATVVVSYSGLVGANPNFIRVYAYITALGLPAGDLGQINSAEFTTASGSVNVTLTFTTPQLTGTNITLWVSQFESITFATVSDVRPTFNCEQPVPAGPFAPAGYTNRLITCTVPVRDAPNGNVVPGATLIAGQTWPVSNTPIGGWYGVFVGSVVYIPASCVQGGVVGVVPPPPVPTPPPGFVPPPVFPPFVPRPPSAPTNPFLYEPPSYPGSGYVYIVQPGDNLFRIARRFAVPLSVLAAYNGITNPARIFVGQRIVIP